MKVEEKVVTTRLVVLTREERAKVSEYIEKINGSVPEVTKMTLKRRERYPISSNDMIGIPETFFKNFRIHLDTLKEILEPV